MTPKEELMEALKDNKHLHNFGIDIGKLFTDYGLPIDISLSNLSHTKSEKIALLHGALSWLIEHKRTSGASDESIERQRKTNKKLMENFIVNDEVGIY